MQSLLNQCSREPLITTIIPTYRRPQLLKKAVESVLNQTYPHFQIWVYDNASGDETASIVQELQRQDSRVKYYCHCENIGPVANFQYGLSRVATPFFSFLSDDDLLLPPFFEMTLQKLEEYAEAMFAVGPVINARADGQMLHVHRLSDPQKHFWSPPEGLYEMIQNNINWAGILFRKDVIDKVGLLDENVKVIDADYVLRIASRCSFAATSVPCAVFMQHTISYSTNAGLKLIWPSWPRMTEKLLQDPEIPAIYKPEIRRRMIKRMSDFLFPIALKSLSRKEIDQSLKIADILERECNEIVKSPFIRRVAKSIGGLKYIYFSFIGLVKLRQMVFKSLKSKWIKMQVKA